MKVSRILLPVDGSRPSDAAADMAVSIARPAAAEVVVLHVRKTVPTGLGQPNADRLLANLTAQAELVMERYRGRLQAAGVSFTELIVGGETAETIVATARAEKCDLIVMGSKGKSDLEGLILGSVTHKVLHTAPQPVLVVK